MSGVCRCHLRFIVPASGISASPFLITAASSGGMDFIAKALLARAASPCYARAMTEATIQSAGSRPAPQAGPRPKAPWQVWRDAAGRLSPLRIGTLALLFVPVAIALYDYNTAGFGARPVNDVIHRTGYWALIFVMLALAITPLR